MWQEVCSFPNGVVNARGSSQEPAEKGDRRRPRGGYPRDVVMRLRPGQPEVSPRNGTLGTVLQAGLFTDGAPGTEIHDDVAPRPGDIVVAKRRASAFSGSDLDLVLRARDINSLVLTGIATSGVVLHTLCRANDLDFGLTVLSDACLDLDPEVHRTLIEKLFPQWAEVVTVEDWVGSLAHSGG